MTYENTLKKIYSFKGTAGAPTLERMRLLCRYLGDPQRKLKFIHVAGTNGKGSFSAMLDSVLRAASFITGRYISPYILDFRERMTCNGDMIEREELVSLAARVFEASDTMQNDIEKAKNGEETPFPIPRIILDGRTSSAPVQFEIVTAIAFLFFVYHGCELVILECGLGGRFDATNVIEPPLLSVIMSIGLDHTELLGNTLPEIAAEKCGIIKKGTDEVISYPQSPEVMEVISRHCIECGARLTVPLKRDSLIGKSTLGGLSFTYREKEYRSRLSAAYQLSNAATVIEAAEALRRFGYDIDYEHVCKGLADTVFPARFEVLGVMPTVIVDGAHNDSGIRALCESVEAVLPCISGDMIFALGMLRDKNPENALRPFAELVNSGRVKVKKIITLTPDNMRAMPAEELCEILSDLISEEIQIVSVDEIGKKKTRRLYKELDSLEKEDALITFGSLYLAAELRKDLKSFLDYYNV